MGQTIESVCVCQCVSVSGCQSVSVCDRHGHSHGCISWSILTKILTDVKIHKKKNEIVKGQYRIKTSNILPLPEKNRFAHTQ